MIALSENSSFGQRYITVEKFVPVHQPRNVHMRDMHADTKIQGKNKGVGQLNDKVMNFVFYVLNKDVCFIFTVALI